ncbi:vanadium-dependent haloperoxidase [Spirosoma soli]|uniref:Vanadium-dependent haloperoxidase n=1 Tax=Spirosoma soli TaxID=1770529 RepID=A0ABW5MAF0_9BACT
MSLYVIKNSPYNSPTYSSRSLAYLGITMYESVVHSNPAYRSLAGQINGLAALPQPQPKLEYNWPLVLNAAQASMLYKLYPHGNIMGRVDSLQTAVANGLAATEKQDVVERSVIYGWSLANAIFDWSKTDGGYEGYSRNFNPNYKVPVGKSYWVAPPKGSGQSPSLYPLHPDWGQNRTFVASNGTLPLPTLLEYSSLPGSLYYKEHEAVYKKNKVLTKEEKEIAIWWADDPAHTAAPPGHSYNVATTTIKVAKPDLVKAAETYARVGMAVADAFITCWKCKYMYHRERPSTFITATISKEWRPFWPEPPFPAFSSGHSTQAAAAATVLTDLYGKRIELTDSTHYGHPPDPITGTAYKPRRFKSFWAMAVECANSRFYGGIHTNNDNQVGLTEGKKIGDNINKLVWRR